MRKSIFTGLPSFIIRARKLPSCGRRLSAMSSFPIILIREIISFWFLLISYWRVPRKGSFKTPSIRYRILSWRSLLSIWISEAPLFIDWLIIWETSEFAVLLVWVSWKGFVSVILSVSSSIISSSAPVSASSFCSYNLEKVSLMAERVEVTTLTVRPVMASSSSISQLQVGSSIARVMVSPILATGTTWLWRA